MPLPVCLARSIGLKIVKSARLRTEMIFLPKHEVIYKIYGYKKKTPFKLPNYAKKALGS